MNKRALLLAGALTLTSCDWLTPGPADYFPPYVVLNRCGFDVQVTALGETRVLGPEQSATYMMDSAGAEYTYSVSLPGDPSSAVSFNARADRVELAGTRCPNG